MATDRILYWQRGRKPTREEAEKVCTNFVSNDGQVTWSDETARFFLHFVGPTSRALDGLSGVSEQAQAKWDHEKANEKDGRWIEVFIDDAHLDVITRGQDEFTCALADGLLAVFQMWWQPSTKPGGHHPRVC